MGGEAPGVSFTNNTDIIFPVGNKLFMVEKVEVCQVPTVSPQFASDVSQLNCRNTCRHDIDGRSIRASKNIFPARWNKSFVILSYIAQW